MKRRKSLPFFFAMAGCRNRCVYCDQAQITGIRTAPTPKEVRRRLEELDDAVEICFFGGSFTCLHASLVESYLEATAFAPSGSSLRLSTHPLCLAAGTIRLLKEATRGTCPVSCVEVGISSLDNAVLQTCARGYTAEEALRSVGRLLQEGLPTGVQIMIGLPGQDIESTFRDLRLLAQLKGPCSLALRIYPCLVLKGTPLESLWKSGKYGPLETEQAARWTGRLLVEALDLGFEVLRVGLAETDSLASSVSAGPHHPAFGELAWGECAALLLVRNSERGPWVEHWKKRSLFFGHGKRGIRRLAELSGQKDSEALARLSFWPGGTGFREKEFSRVDNPENEL